MGYRARRQEELPPTGAGLIRYFREEAHGIKVSPKSVALFTIGVIVFVILLHTWKPI